jgi:hypothetical protein
MPRRRESLRRRIRGRPTIAIGSEPWPLSDREARAFSASEARMIAIAVGRLLAVVVATTPAAAAATDAESQVTLFSKGQPGTTLPPGWVTQKITDQKRPTIYDLVDDGGTVVLRARAESAATGLGLAVSFDLRATPIVEWRWKVKGLIRGADNAVASKEDSPVRLVLEFDGDKSKLNFSERGQLALGATMSGHESPYATLMYVWANTYPVDTVVQNPRTARVQMIVASSGAGGVGAWPSLRRNVVEDYRRAFKEEPGRLLGVGVLSDTDNTGETIEAWYGDIRFVGQ